jgi:hypothetical protein
MTEQEWANGTDLRPVLDHLLRQGRHRKVRLFACGCCRIMDRRITDHHRNASGLAVVALAEQVADGLLSLEEARHGERNLPRLAWDSWTLDDPFRVVHHFGNQALAWRGIPRLELLRCIAGNPFHNLTAAPAWLIWGGGTVPRVAQVIYDEHRWEDLPILADALEDAGCTDADILNHCRGSGPHGRGCWVVDAFLRGEGSSQARSASDGTPTSPER